MRKSKNVIVQGLNAYLNVSVVPTDTTDPKPPYPYVSYKIISALEGDTFALVDEIVPSDNPNFQHDVKVTRKEQSHFTISINAYSLDEDEARNLAIETADWFKFHGYDFLKGHNLVVAKTGNIIDRTQQIVDDYERRYGFDVRIRAAREITKRVDTIESFTINQVVTANS